MGEFLHGDGGDSPAEAAAWDDAGEWIAGPRRRSARPPTTGEHLLADLRQAARWEGAYLVPLRVSIGLGWLGASAEKLTDPGWRDGAALTAFLDGQLATGAVTFPPTPGRSSPCSCSGRRRSGCWCCSATCWSAWGSGSAR